MATAEEVQQRLWGTFGMSISVQVLLVGVYTYYMTTALRASFTRTLRSQWSTAPNALAVRVTKLITAGIVAIFAILAIALALSILRGLAVVHSLLQLNGFTTATVLGRNEWLYAGNTIVLWVLSLVGDTLMVYQCYNVWEGDIKPVIMPLIILLGHLCSGIALIVWTAQIYTSKDQIYIITLAIYALEIGENLVIGTLLILRILLRIRKSRAAGIDPQLRSFKAVAWNIGQSIVIRAMLLVVVTILFIAQTSLCYDFQDIAIPAIGLNFIIFWRRLPQGSDREVNIQLNELRFQVHAQPASESSGLGGAKELEGCASPVIAGSVGSSSVIAE